MVSRSFPAEAEIVREIFASYLDGGTPRSIARSLNARNVATVGPHRWEGWRVLGVIDSRHVAGIQVFRGEEIGRGEWEPIIDAGTFAEAVDRRTFRAARAKDVLATNRRFYLLRGLVTCSLCGIRMVGGGGKYICPHAYRIDGPRCSRLITAPRLESFVVDAALYVLENLHLRADAPTTTLSDDDQAAVIEVDGELAELKAMWDAHECTTREYRQMRAVLEDRRSRLQAKTVIRPTASILNGLTGPNARPAWQDMTDTGQGERQNAILRFLFAAVIINRNGTRGRFDYSRIHIDPNPL
jgi:hypothetical protein